MPKIKFIDFCAGIGAGRLALENLGMECVGFSEIDKKAEITYREIFNNNEVNFGDVMAINPNSLPNFDLMIAGFPCQSFSEIGNKKGMGDTRGQIIIGLINILKTKKVPYFILENVKGLVNHDGGNTLKVILEMLNDAGYTVQHKILNSLDFGVPQLRNRIYLVGIRKDLVNKKDFIWSNNKGRVLLKDFLIDETIIEKSEKIKSYKRLLNYVNNKVNMGKFNLNELLKKDYLIIDTRQSDLRIYENLVPTLRAGNHGILYVKNSKFHKLTGFETLLLQGFSVQIANKLSIKIDNYTLLKQAGNAMTINVIEMVGKSLIESIN